MGSGVSTSSNFHLPEIVDYDDVENNNNNNNGTSSTSPIVKDKKSYPTVGECIKHTILGNYSILYKNLHPINPLSLTTSEVHSVLVQAAMFGRLDIIELFTQIKSAQPTSSQFRPRIGKLDDSNSGKLPLHEASQRAKTDAVELLLAAKQLPTEKDTLGQTALHKACNSSDVGGDRQVTVATLLHVMDADDVNVGDERGNTALHFAAQNNNMKLCEMLLSSGAIATRRNNRRKSPGQAATDLNFLELGNALESGLKKYVNALRRNGEIKARKRNSKRESSNSLVDVDVDKMMEIWNCFFENAMKSPINKKKISPRVVVYDPTNYSPVRARRTNVNEYKNEFLATKVRPGRPPGEPSNVTMDPPHAHRLTPPHLTPRRSLAAVFSENFRRNPQQNLLLLRGNERVFLGRPERRLLHSEEVPKVPPAQ